MVGTGFVNLPVKMNHDFRCIINLKKNCCNKISKVVWNNEEFKAVFDCTGEDADKGLGAHSTRRHSADFADKAGAEVARVLDMH